MVSPYLLAGSVVIALAALAVAQAPTPTPTSTPTPPPAAASKEEALRRAFVDADGSRKTVLYAAADHVVKSDAAQRARFVETVRAIAAVAPKPAPAATEAAPGTPAPTPAPAGTGTPGTEPAPASTKVAPPADAKPVEFADDTKKTMATVVTGPADASKQALAKLAQDTQAGTAALARLDERGKAVLARCITTIVRTKMETNALFAGQYAELADFEPEASALLLRWAAEPPKDVARPDAFAAACVRALRDIVPGDKGTDVMRKTLGEVAGKAQKARNEPLFLAAVCALHQYGDPTTFDRIKGNVEKQAAGDDVQAKTAATNTLAELHYQLRQYEQAADYYKQLVALLEQPGAANQNLTTVIYNTACSLSLAKRTDEAFQYLEKALQSAQGQLNKVMLDSDHDLNNLRADPRFQKLMEQHFNKAAPAGK
jgi:tetratricopeptide (TPR) repeat protein